MTPLLENAHKYLDNFHKHHHEVYIPQFINFIKCHEQQACKYEALLQSDTISPLSYQYLAMPLQTYIEQIKMINACLLELDENNLIRIKQGEQHLQKLGDSLTTIIQTEQDACLLLDTDALLQNVHAVLLWTAQYFKERSMLEAMQAQHKIIY